MRPAEEYPSLHARVAAPLNFVDLTRSNIHLKRAVESHSTLPVFLRNAVTPWRQRNPKPALIVRGERCNRVISLLYDEGRIRQRFRIGNAPSHWPTRDAAEGNHPFESCARLGRRRGRCLGPGHATKQSEQRQKRFERLELVQRWLDGACYPVN